jgi:pyruvate-formate lyase-activating enzyme
MIVVAVNNACNYRCAHCYYPIYRADPHYEPQNLSADVFTKIAAEAGRYPHAILRLIGWGEPLLHPQLVEFVRLARQAAPRNRLTLITNGYYLTPAVSLELMEAGLDLVEISLDAACPQTYHRLRVSPDADAFERVQANVREMLRQRTAGGLATRVVVSSVVWPTAESTAEFDAFSQKWAGVVDDVVKRPAHTFIGAIPSARSMPEVRPPCYSLWARCAVNPWGQVSVCYNDWKRRNVLGDLHDPDTSIHAIWTGPRLEELRDGQLAGHFSGCCAGCEDYNPASWQHPYEEVVERGLGKQNPA